MEIRRAMERHQAGETRVIPILLRPIDWTGAIFSWFPVFLQNCQPVTTWEIRMSVSGNCRWDSGGGDQVETDEE